MKRKTLIFFSLLVLIIGCKRKDNIQVNIDGKYIGTFERNGNQSNVALTFNNGTFSGQSEMPKFPALCNGTYTRSENLITFVNGCPWTAEFDWTFILAGEWKLDLKNNILVMTKSNGDKYTLTRQ